MNPMKKRISQKVELPKAKAFKGSLPSGKQKPVVANNGVMVKVEDKKGFEEYLIYKQLKEEISDFYPYPSLWLESPHEQLGGQTPLQLALSGPVGREVVLNLIQMIKAGMFT